jgi:hypothetical protein
MHDAEFISSILHRGKQAKEKVNTTFSGISVEQLNWKPAPGSWSIAQCLQHLMISHIAYFPIFREIGEGNYHMNFWERNSPFSRTLGRAMKKRLQEQVGRKMKAPQMIRPTKSEFNIVLLDRYDENLDEYLDLILHCKDVDLDKTIITSPILPFVTYSLRDAFQFLLQHEHRHINQAIRVKENDQSQGNNPARQRSLNRNVNDDIYATLLDFANIGLFDSSWFL